VALVRVRRAMMTKKIREKRRGKSKRRKEEREMEI
jgi:hypothetical protein